MRREKREVNCKSVFASKRRIDPNEKGVDSVCRGKGKAKLRSK